MKKNVKRYVLLAMIVSLIIEGMNFSGFVSAAKKVSLTKFVKVTVGKSSAITLKNNQKKVTWKVVKGKNIVKITKNSKTGCTVKGLKKGTAIVQAYVAKKSYKCTVTVIAKKAGATASSDETKEPQATSVPQQTSFPEETKEPQETNNPEKTAQPDESEEPDDTPVSKVIEYDGTNAEEVYACKEPFSLIIKDGVKEIPKWEFSNNYNLYNVTIPTSVESIGEYAFDGCTKITSIVIPTGVIEIGRLAFCNCSKLSSISISESVASIGDNIFWNCDNLKSIVVDADNKIYDSRENSNAIIEKSDNKLIEGCQNTVIPSSVTSIAGDALSGCGKLKEIIIPKGVTSIGAGAFTECRNLTAIIVDKENLFYDSREDCNAIIEKSNNKLIVGCKNTKIPTGVEIIESSAFKECYGLKNIIIPFGVKSIGYNAFAYCSNLESVTIPESVECIEDCAFQNCYALKELKIPASVTKIGDAVFRGDGSLISISVDKNNKFYDSRENCNAIIEKSNNKLIIGCKNTSIPMGITSIGDYSFESCRELEKISIPTSVTDIGKYAFGYCDSLKSIIIPVQIVSVAWDAFEHCDNLNNITWNGNTYNSFEEFYAAFSNQATS